MKEVIITVVGSEPPCPKCINALMIATRVARKRNVEVEHMDVFSTEARRLKVLVVPSVFVNDRLVSAGDVLGEEELARFVDEALHGNSSEK